MKLGIFSRGYPGVTESGGIPTYARALALGLVEEGHEVHVLTVALKDQAPQTLVVDGVNLHVVKAEYLPVVDRFAPMGWEAVSLSARARWLTLRHKLDLFEFPNWEGLGAFYNVARRGAPLVVRLHTSYKEIVEIEGRPLSRKEEFGFRLEARTCLSADALIVSTRAHRAFMERELGIPEGRISIVPLGIPDLKTRRAGGPRPRNAEPIVLYLGRLEPRKGAVDLLEATRLVTARIPNVRFVLIGKDRPQAPGGVTHQAWFQANFPPEVVRRVEFLGFQDDDAVDQWFSRADLFVAPSLYESFGLIFIEAMRSDVPVVGTRAGGIPEVVSHGVSGLLVDPQAPGRLAEAILAILEDEPRRQELARGARREYETRFSNRVMARRQVEHHQELLQRMRRDRGFRLG